MMRNEKALLISANAGDINSIKALARRYDKQSGRWTEEPNVGESVSIEEFFANMEREEHEPSKAKAFEWFMKGAELGDPECMYEIGRRIYDNIGCEEKPWPDRRKLAFDWYLKSAQAGYVPAMRIAAYMYAGLAVEENLPESFRWYLKAAELGDKNSACEVAKYYVLGKGTEKNLAEADKWLAILEDKNYRDTLHELAKADEENKIMWLDRLIERDDPLAMKYKADALVMEEKFPEALELYIKAGASKSHYYNPIFLAEALVQAGTLYYTGDAGIQSYDKALEYYTMAARKRYIKAMIHCGKMHYARGEFDKAEKYLDYAANHSERLPFQNYISGIAREYMAHICEQQGNLDEAYHWYELAAKDYYHTGMKFKMADAYFYGDGVPQDIQKALDYYNEVAESKWHDYYFEAQTKLAWIYELGEGVDKDFAKADEYWKELPPEFKPARA